jgi:hypothetical protein
VIYEWNGRTWNTEEACWTEENEPHPPHLVYPEIFGGGSINSTLRAIYGIVERRSPSLIERDTQANAEQAAESDRQQMGGDFRP